MAKFGVWLPLMLVFSLTIGGIQSLGWWSRRASAPAQVSQSAEVKPSAVSSLSPGGSRHWCAMVLQQ